MCVCVCVCVCFDTQAFLSLSLNGRSQHAMRAKIVRRAEIFCEMIAKFFFPVDFLQGLYRGSPTRRHNNNIRTQPKELTI